MLHFIFNLSFAVSFFQNKLFRKNISGFPLECKILVSKLFARLSADERMVVFAFSRSVIDLHKSMDSFGPI